jgi:SLOG in TRPM, prokaryote
VLSGSAGPTRTSLIRVTRSGDIPAALEAHGLRLGRPVLVLVGGADAMDWSALTALDRTLRSAVLPLLDRRDATAVDGGTDSGVMRVIGRARSAADHRFPLVGVAADGTVVVPGSGPADPDRVALEPNHTHVVLVPGSEWGDESPWLAEVADVVADGAPTVTVAVNGGEITFDDALASLDRGRPVVILAGTGRTADEIAGARAGRASDPRAMKIAAARSTHVLPVGDAAAIADVLEAILRGNTDRP